jgi:hypothetical protein
MKMPSRALGRIFVGLSVALALAAAPMTLAKGKDWEAKAGQGRVTVMKEGKQLCVVKTAAPNIEETKFVKWQGKKCLAVKSRGNHGPASCELFDAKTGSLVDKVMAYAIEDSKQSWAAGWKE